MKTYSIAAVGLTALLLLSACAKSGGPKSGENGGADPVAMGTVTGGGGNGLDNKAIESYTVRIDELPEFKRYIVPVIRRISRGKGDVLSAYMTYVIKNKPWYLIPRSLEEVPKERVGLGFKTEQLALHSEGGVYLHKASYLKKNQKERAELLMHEIVMGVRLLMKKSPVDQCEKLAGNDLKACSDPDMMALAQTQNFDAKDQVIMSEVDHDAVRALTIFLMQRTEEVTAQAVALKRRQLKFLFPWDQAVSQLTMEEVKLILRRANLADKKYRLTNGPNGIPKDADIRCRWDDIQMFDNDNIDIRLFPTSDYSADSLISKTLPSRGLMWASTYTNYNTYGESYVWTSGSGFFAKGILDPNDSKKVIDLVTVQPDITDEMIGGGLSLYQFELLITREKQPKLLEIRTNPLKVLLKSYTGIKSRKDYELVPQDSYALRCKLEESSN